LQKQKKIVVFSGAGISAESGLDTFRDSGGLWANHNIEDVATPNAWIKNKKLVLDFYNKRRKLAFTAKPNIAHYSIASLEDRFEVQIITQNIDKLHERSGSSNVLHLHGEIDMVKSTGTNKIYKHGNKDVQNGDLCPDGYQLRPHVVWFGEDVPNMNKAMSIISSAEVLIITGTSLNVFPASNIIFYAPKISVKYLVDPSDIRIKDIYNLFVYKENASIGIPKIVEKLLNDNI
jgi:NAD-dependent deacetylase